MVKNSVFTTNIKSLVYSPWGLYTRLIDVSSRFGGLYTGAILGGGGYIRNFTVLVFDVWANILCG